MGDVQPNPFDPYLFDIHAWYESIKRELPGMFAKHGCELFAVESFDMGGWLGLAFRMPNGRRHAFRAMSLRPLSDVVAGIEDSLEKYGKEPEPA